VSPGDSAQRRVYHGVRVTTLSGAFCADRLTIEVYSRLTIDELHQMASIGPRPNSDPFLAYA
jgi:hypothetical protein